MSGSRDELRLEPPKIYRKPFDPANVLGGTSSRSRNYKPPLGTSRSNSHLQFSGKKDVHNSGISPLEKLAKRVRTLASARKGQI